MLCRLIKVHVADANLAMVNQTERANVRLETEVRSFEKQWGHKLRKVMKPKPMDKPE